MRAFLRIIGVCVIIPLLALLSLPGHAHLRNGFRIEGPQSPEVADQIEYANKYYAKPNVAGFGYLGNVDCANFANQTLWARGWRMDDEWWQDQSAYEGYKYSAAWISSTALNDYLMRHPQRARPMSWAHKDSIQVGDIVMFDWDSSGDRDHTAVVSGIRHGFGSRELLLTAHSEGMFNYPLSQELARNPDSTQVYFWRIMNAPPKPILKRILEPAVPKSTNIFQPKRK